MKHRFSAESVESLMVFIFDRNMKRVDILLAHGDDLLHDAARFNGRYRQLNRTEVLKWRLL
jgi:hypothetical protein